MTNLRKAVIVFAVILIGTFAAIETHVLPRDNEAFAAFYCAGEALDTGHDPYRIEPLRSCERRVAPGVNPPDVVEPAPLPGYALAPFALLARIPYGAASAIFLVTLVAAIAATVFAITDVTLLPMTVSLAAFVIVGTLNVTYGDTPPLAIAALALGGLAISRGRDALAALAAIAAMIEPHLGIAACAALLVWRPKTRPVLAAGAVFCTVLSLVVSSPAGFVEYFTRVLPLQSRSETPAPDQYSLTWLAHILGANDALATALGSISFFVFVIIGVFAAKRVARAYRDDAMLVYFPTAAAMLFGVFVHDIELPAAMLAALTIAAATRKPAAWVAVGVLSLAWMPWWRGVELIQVLSIFAVVTIARTAAGHVSRLRLAQISLSAGFGYVALLLAYNHVLPLTPIGAPVSPWISRAALSPHMQAGWNWGTLIRALPMPQDQTVQLVVGKIIVWIALAYVLLAALFGSARRQAPARKIEPGTELPSVRFERRRALSASSSQR